MDPYSNLSPEQRTEYSKSFFFMPIYPFLYSALRWHYKTYGIFTPEKVWYEAIRFTKDVEELPCPELQAEECIEQLGADFSSADASFLVALAASYRLYPITRRDSTMRDIVTLLLERYVKSHPHRDSMLERIAYSEDEAKLQKYRIDMVTYQLIDISVVTNDSPRLLFIERQKMIGEQVNEAIELGLDAMNGYLPVLTSVNNKHDNVFCEQLSCLIQGIKDVGNNQPPVQFIFNDAKVERLIDSHGTYIENIKDYHT